MIAQNGFVYTAFLNAFSMHVKIYSHW